MTQEVLVARCTLVTVNEGQEIKVMSKEAVKQQYPVFAMEVQRELAKFPAGAPVTFYWQTVADLQKDKLGVIACMSN